MRVTTRGRLARPAALPARHATRSAPRAVLLAVGAVVSSTACVAGTSASGGGIAGPPNPGTQTRLEVSPVAEPESLPRGGEASGKVAGPEDVAGVEPAREPVRHPFHEPLPDASLPPDAPAMRHANLSPAQCRAEVKRRKLAFRRDHRPTPGVATALRFTETIDGVRFLSAGYKSKFGVLDCRLALNLAELAGVLREHSVAAVSMGTIYRIKARLPSRRPSQHAHGLAADVVGFELEDGRTLLFERDWHGEVGTAPCGPEGVLKESTEDAVALRNLVCDIARRGFFHHMLTPSYNLAHHDHLHVDIKRDAGRWMIQ